MKLETPRGIRDISPEEYSKMLEILDIFRELTKVYGFKIMEPATIEKFETLALKSGEEIEKEIYSFIDKGGRKLGLRFDLTVGLTRYVVTRPELQKPVKLAAFSVQWRYDEPQRGRYRSFYAWDVEIYGGDELYSALETLLFTHDLLEMVGLENSISLISDRRVVENILRERFNIDDPVRIMRIIDKWGKKTEEELIDMMVQAEVSENIAKEVLNTFFKERKIDLQTYGGEKLLTLRDLCRDLGLKNVQIDMSIVRGLDYYDGIVFETRPSREEALSLVGGGNYSTLVRVFGGDFNAFGAAGGVERLLMYLKGKEKDEPEGVYVIPVSEETTKYAIDICRRIRREGVRCEYPLTKRSISRNLRYAVRNKYKWVIFIGEDEMRKGVYTVKNLTTEKQETLTLDEVIQLVTNT